MASDNLMSAVFPSAASPARAFRFACDERPASEANDVSACDERVVYGAFIPSQNPRAGPPRDALLSRCFLVTSLHQQRSDPLSEGQRKLCSGQQRSDPLSEGQRKLWLSKVTRSTAGGAEALALQNQQYPSRAERKLCSSGGRREPPAEVRRLSGGSLSPLESGGAKQPRLHPPFVQGLPQRF